MCYNEENEMKGGGLMELVAPMTELLSSITTVLSSGVSWFTSVSTALISNEVFLIILGIVIMLTLATFLVNLVGKIRTRARNK